MMNHEDAKAACEADGMHLVTIRTQAELQALEAHMGGQDSIWLGANTGVQGWQGPDEKMYWHDAGPRFDEASYTGWVDITLGQGTGCVWVRQNMTSFHSRRNVSSHLYFLLLICAALLPGWKCSFR